MQGIGWALNEEYFFNDQGQMMNSSFLDYRMPTTLDLLQAAGYPLHCRGHPYLWQDYPPPLALLAASFHTASIIAPGDMGILVIRTPVAFWTALAMAAIGGTRGNSATPRRP